MVEPATGPGEVGSGPALATAEATERRPCGRPRSAEADRAILDAALERFAEVGYEGLTIEAVADRAGVAKSTVYRRYPSKSELLMAAAARCAAADSWDTDRGSLEGDLRALARHLREVFTGTDLGRIVPALLAASARHADLAAQHRQFIAGRRRVTIDAIGRAVARGELPSGTDAQLLADAVVGPIFFRVFVSGGDVSDAELDHLVSRVVRAFV